MPSLLWGHWEGGDHPSITGWKTTAAWLEVGGAGGRLGQEEAGNNFCSFQLLFNHGLVISRGHVGAGCHFPCRQLGISEEDLRLISMCKVAVIMI